jgi:hypothetical protein
MSAPNVEAVQAVQERGLCNEGSCEVSRRCRNAVSHKLATNTVILSTELRFSFQDTCQFLCMRSEWPL